jgi:Zn-dependent protease
VNYSWRIARIAGTDVKLHSTFLLALAFYMWQGYREGGWPDALQTGGFVLVLFLCVLLHEFGHIAMARRFGVRTPDVLLLPIGGMARLERIPEEPIQEFLIALAGPAVTLAIAFSLYLLLSATSGVPTIEDVRHGGASFLSQVMSINWYLLLFNFIPAIPMDGGRMLRSLLALKLGYFEATRAASVVGRILAAGMLLYGLFGTPPNIILVLIALFVYFAAASEVVRAQTSSTDSDLPLGELMLTEFLTVQVHTRLGVASEQIRHTRQNEFPVTDNFGHLEGLFTRANLLNGLTAYGTGGTVAEAMLNRVPVLSPQLPFRNAYRELKNSGLPALPVVDNAGMVVGVLSLDRVKELILGGRLKRGITPTSS